MVYQRETNFLQVGEDTRELTASSNRCLSTEDECMMMFLIR